MQTEKYLDSCFFSVSQSAASPYSGQGRLLQVGRTQRLCISYDDITQGGNTQYQHGSPHVPLKPAKRSATPEHMLSDQVLHHHWLETATWM